MAAGIAVNLTLRNAEGLQANFRAADAVAQRQFRKAVADHARGVLLVAKSYCPVDTGFMRDHLRAEFTPSGLVSDIGWWESDFADAELPFYPPYQEFGTIANPPQPCLYPAFMLLQPGFVQKMADTMAASLARGFRGGAR